MTRHVLPIVGFLCVINLLAILVVEGLAMAQVRPDDFTTSVTPRDYWLMVWCIGTLAIASACVLAAYIDVLFLRVRAKWLDVTAAVVSLALLCSWIVAGMARSVRDSAPTFNAYVLNHSWSLAASAVAAVLLVGLVLWPKRA
jgi:hypothetical protein